MASLPLLPTLNPTSNLTASVTTPTPGTTQLTTGACAYFPSLPGCTVSSSSNATSSSTTHWYDPSSWVNGIFTSRFAAVILGLICIAGAIYLFKGGSTNITIAGVQGAAHKATGGVFRTNVTGV